MFAEHAARGTLRSGSTVKVALRAMDEVGAEFIQECVNQVALVEKDADAFVAISDSVGRHIKFLESQVRRAATKANVFDLDRLGMLAEVEKRLERELALHRFPFTMPSTAPSAPKGAAPPVSSGRVGGRPSAAFWDDMWASVASDLYDGTLIPRTQADIERAMFDWIEKHGQRAAESTVRERARRLWNRISTD